MEGTGVEEGKVRVVKEVACRVGGARLGPVGVFAGGTGGGRARHPYRGRAPGQTAE